MFQLEPNIPNQLQDTQEWFASIITVPIDENSRIRNDTPDGPIEEVAKKYIAPSPTLQPFQRIELYNQQYWWRLLSRLHESVPTTTRLFGHTEFNKVIGIPYLLKYPPNHWSLNTLGNNLDHWIEEEYREKDKVLVHDATKIDIAYNKAFFTPQYPSLTNEDINGNPSDILQQSLYLQPHTHFFKFRYDLFAFRKEFLAQEPEYWVEHDFPKLKKGEFHFLLFRDRKNAILWKELEAEEFAVLQLFQEGTSVEEICSWIESQNDTFQEKAAANLAAWFKEWTFQGLLFKKC